MIFNLILILRLNMLITCVTIRHTFVASTVYSWGSWDISMCIFISVLYLYATSFSVIQYPSLSTSTSTSTSTPLSHSHSPFPFTSLYLSLSYYLNFYLYLSLINLIVFCLVSIVIFHLSFSYLSLHYL